MRQPLKIILCGFVFLATISLADPPISTRADRNLNDFIEVSVASLLDTGDGSIILLKENAGERLLPIVVGDPETRAIVLGLARRQNARAAPRIGRPLTHNLLLDIVARLGAEVDRIAVSDLKDNTYYADVYLKTADRQEIKIDARPSDAIALAVTLDKPIPIFVTRALMARAGKKGSQLLEPDDGEKKKSLRL